MQGVFLVSEAYVGEVLQAFEELEEHELEVRVVVGDAVDVLGLEDFCERADDGFGDEGLVSGAYDVGLFVERLEELEHGAVHVAREVRGFLADHVEHLRLELLAELVAGVLGGFEEEDRSLRGGAFLERGVDAPQAVRASREVVFLVLAHGLVAADLQVAH